MKFNQLYNKIINESVYIPSNQIGIPTTGSPRWTWIWTVKMFIYHNTRQYKNFFQNWAKEFQATWNGTIDKLNNSNGKPLNLAIAKDDRTIYIYPNAIVDKIDGTTLHFHLDPRKYREYKGFGYQVQTTNLQYWYNRNHQSNQAFAALEEEYGIDIAIKNGIKMEDAGFYWYKVYGKEQGQLTDFYVRAKNVMILEDLTAAWDKLIALYEQMRKEQIEAQKKQRVRNAEINKRSQEILSNEAKKKEVDELYNQVLKNKDKMNELSIDQLKDIQAMAYYRYYNHHEIYALDHKTAQMADDYRHYSSQKAWLAGIEENDRSLLINTTKVLDEKQKGE